MATEIRTTVRVCRKRLSSRSELAMISKLGDDILEEILIRLPNPRSACRSKAVCKHWRCLISDPGFRRRFLSHHHQSKNSQPPPSELLLSGDSLLSFLPMPAYYHRYHRLEEFAVFDCFEDLLLCGFGDVGNCYSDSELARSYLLCNPFTKQWIALPLAPGKRPLGRIKDLAARLVCEPSSCSSSLDEVSRFRVVLVYQDRNSVKLDVFCSELGEWKLEAIVLDGYRRCGLHDVVSCNGVVYAPCARARDIDARLRNRYLVTSFDPFHLHLPPAPIDVPPPIGAKEFWRLSVSRGALHLSVYERLSKPYVLSVWRLEQDGKLVWTKVCEGTVRSSPVDNCLFGFLGAPTLHPEKPEIAFFTNCGGSVGDLGSCNVSCNLVEGGGELEFVSELTQPFLGWRVFQPKVCCWPTQIPRYQKLRAMYDGGYRCWVQIDDDDGRPTTLTEERRRIDGVEKSGDRKKKAKAKKKRHAPIGSKIMKGMALWPWFKKPYIIIGRSNRKYRVPISKR